MKIHRIYSILVKTVYLTRRTPDRLADLFYWSALDLFIWGLTSSYLVSFAPHSNILKIILSDFIFWIVVWRGQQEISVNLLEDLWNKNLVNVFVTPITFGEWIVSFMIVSLTKTAMSFALGTILAVIVYHVNILAYGLYLIPIIGILLLSAWGFGFFISSLILRFGTKVQNLAWSFVSLLAPFSAIYYPLSILPHWAQWIAHVLPTSYIFQTIRTLIVTGKFDSLSILIGLGLATFYFILSLLFVRSSFQAVLRKGLVKVF